MSVPSLLDVNVLVALFNPDHVHHDIAHDWFADHQSDGWATCPLTENGFVRVLAQPAAHAVLLRVGELVERLATFCAGPRHLFWDDSISLRDGTLFDPALAAGHRHVTDIYLLGLAKTKGGKLATFDRSIPVAAVVGATAETLAILSDA